ncbi:MAG: hypothetical protein EBZ48_17880, partial [Proteobacteria bacterium]|nr:hypothetical protein [Pseudomonadota bacterium]
MKRSVLVGAAALTLSLMAVTANADILCVKTVPVDKKSGKEFHVVSVTLSAAEPCPSGSKPVRDRRGVVAQFSNSTDIKNIALNTFFENVS